jgi:hypothetical protein
MFVGAAEALAALPSVSAAASHSAARQAAVPHWSGNSNLQRQGITAGTVDYSEDFESYRWVGVIMTRAAWRVSCDVLWMCADADCERCSIEDSEQLAQQVAATCSLPVPTLCVCGCVCDC